jgi:hypothetical protein
VIPSGQGAALFAELSADAAAGEIREQFETDAQNLAKFWKRAFHKCSRFHPHERRTAYRINARRGRKKRSSPPMPASARQRR